MTGAVSSAELGLWCDGFDADLLAVVPGVVDVFGDTAGVELWTRSHVTNRRINCPAAWHTDEGLAAFFSTRDREPTPPRHFTRDPLVECTFLEVVRDEWVHGSIVVVNGRVVWRPPVRAMERLMFDVRGWTVLDDDDRGRIRGDVTRGLADAALQLRRVLQAVAT